MNRASILTMSDDLWVIFRENRHLLPKLPTIAADVLQTKALFSVNEERAFAIGDSINRPSLGERAPYGC